MIQNSAEILIQSNRHPSEQGNQKCYNFVSSQTPQHVKSLIFSYITPKSTGKSVMSAEKKSVSAFALTNVSRFGNGFSSVASLKEDG